MVMTDQVRTTYISEDPDYGTLALGYFSEVPFYCNLLSTTLVTPVATDAVLLFDPPVDMAGPDVILDSVEADLGSTENGYVEKTFTFVQTKGFSCAGIIQAIVNATLDLDQVDGSAGGYVSIDSIICELLEYSISTGVSTQIGIQTHTIGKGIAGKITTPVYAQKTISDIFLFDIGLSPKKTYGQSAGTLLQVRMRVNFSAYTGPSSTTTTIAKCSLNCFRTRTQSSKLLIPVV